MGRSTAIAMLLVLGLLGACVLAGCRSHSTAKTAAVTTHVKCEACGYEWDQSASEVIKCPKCGALGVVSQQYRCPRCQAVFVGMEIKKMGPNKFEYRKPGAAAWSAAPEPLKCPKCGFTNGKFTAVSSAGDAPANSGS